MGHGGLDAEPGQFAWITVGHSPFRIREHPFSLSSSADTPGPIRFTIKEAGDFTSRLGELEPGTRAYVDGPYGAVGYERHQGDAFVFLAGGIGISPMLGQLRTLADRGDRRPMWLFFANPTWEDVAVREELDELADRLDLEVVRILEHPPPDWPHATGLISEEMLDAHLPTGVERFRYFICGPGAMMDAVEALLLARGMPHEHLSLERFDLID